MGEMSRRPDQPPRNQGLKALADRRRPGGIRFAAGAVAAPELEEPGLPNRASSLDAEFDEAPFEPYTRTSRPGQAGGVFVSCTVGPPGPVTS